MNRAHLCDFCLKDGTVTLAVMRASFREGLYSITVHECGDHVNAVKGLTFKEAGDLANAAIQQYNALRRKESAKVKSARAKEASA